ncbi:oligosaccharide flippase family protein [candidate division WOR-3 bacterium]|nr:oligosaccharide flippase family protein [candidate division WOR-3 bacterium]
MSQGLRKGFIYSLIGQVLAGIFLFMFQMLAGRWLGVDGYGLLSVIYSSICIVTVFVIDGVVQGLARFIAFYQAKDDNDRVRQSIQTAFIIYVTLLFGALLITLLFRNFFLERLFNKHIIILEQFLLGVWALSLFRFYNGILQGYRQFHILSFGIWVKEFMMFVIMALIVKCWGFSGVEAPWSIAISAVIALLLVIWSSRKKSFPTIKWKQFDKLHPEIIRFIIMGGIISLMNQWIIRSGPILLKIIGGEGADSLAGLFNAMLIPLTPFKTVVIALLLGLLPNLSRAYSTGDEKLIKRYIYKSIAIVGGLIVFIIPIYHFYGPQIVKLLFGNEFIVSQFDTTLLAFVISFLLAGSLLSNIIMARGTPRYSVLSSIIGILGMICVLFWADLPTMKLVETALLVCTFLYTVLQGIYLATVKFLRP